MLVVMESFKVLMLLWFGIPPPPGHLAHPGYYHILEDSQVDLFVNFEALGEVWGHHMANLNSAEVAKTIRAF